MEVDGGKDLHRLVIPFGSNLAFRRRYTGGGSHSIFQTFCTWMRGRGLKEAFIGIIKISMLVFSAVADMLNCGHESFFPIDLSVAKTPERMISIAFVSQPF